MNMQDAYEMAFYNGAEKFVEFVKAEIGEAKVNADQIQLLFDKFDGRKN